jgi:hypothetical protein
MPSCQDSTNLLYIVVIDSEILQVNSFMDKTAWQFEYSKECNANIAFVWSFVTDISNWECIEDARPLIITINFKWNEVFFNYNNYVDHRKGKFRAT